MANNLFLSFSNFLLSGGVSGSSSGEPETVSAIFDDILEQSELTNALLIGIVLFLGVVVGCICMSSFFNRIRK